MARSESESVLPIEHCPYCGGELKIIPAILKQRVIEKILMQLGLQRYAVHAQQISDCIQRQAQGASGAVFSCVPPMLCSAALGVSWGTKTGV